MQVVPDRGWGLRAAVRDGVRVAAVSAPAAGVVVVPADLPCLRVEDVTRVLVSGWGLGGAFVPDRQGSGTTMLLCPPRSSVDPQYGPLSADMHRGAGLRRVDDAPARARHDVDTMTDLLAATVLGLGVETTAVLASEGGTPASELHVH